MSNHSFSRWIFGLLVLGILVAVIGGGVMGGVIGYYVAGNRAPVFLPSVSAELASAKSPSQPVILNTNLSVSSDSAVIDTVKKAEPAVVTVINTLAQQPNFRGQFGPSGATPSMAEGSGVIIDAQGHIITNNHVVEGARQIDVVFNDGTKTTATLVGTDPVSDLAVLQVKGNVPAYVPLGDSDALQLGETVVAIGSPLGSYRGSVTVGVVSGLNRSVDGTGQENLIQTDAAINHGNSGGPLLNLAGQVIGINTLVVRDTTMGDPAQGLGFAIPSNTVASVTQQLMASGKVEYPYLGITYGQITPQSAAEANLPVTAGVLVGDVSPNGPAAKAGIQQDDIITALGDSKIDETHPLRSLLFQYKPGDNVKLTVLRNGKEVTTNITLGTRPAETNVSAPGQ